MIVNIKNMVCERCKIVVKNILTNFGIEAANISLGEIILKGSLPNYTLMQLDAALKETGLELIFDKTNLIVQKIITIILEVIHYSNEPLKIKFSCYLSSRLNYSYNYLAGIFKKVNGITIERYIILQKIEKVKSMLILDEMLLSEIADRMNYSSVSHLSAQFKKITGYNARDYKQIKRSQESLLPVLIAV